uniref:Uncharacterized protein n=1 Tax=Pyxicephalus adspersus TaxID=30357 RepID=A0AAV3A4Z8_PYXAD|nr:TPA: hypothetical protein GDO54_018301 [Pyxicephalus adspersus]
MSITLTACFWNVGGNPPHKHENLQTPCSWSLGQDLNPGPKVAKARVLTSEPSGAYNYTSSIKPSFYSSIIMIKQSVFSPALSSWAHHPAIFSSHPKQLRLGFV